MEETINKNMKEKHEHITITYDSKNNEEDDIIGYIWDQIQNHETLIDLIPENTKEFTIKYEVISSENITTHEYIKRCFEHLNEPFYLSGKLFTPITMPVYTNSGDGGFYVDVLYSVEKVLYVTNIPTIILNPEYIHYSKNLVETLVKAACYHSFNKIAENYEQGTYPNVTKQVLSLKFNIRNTNEYFQMIFNDCLREDLYTGVYSDIILNESHLGKWKLSYLHTLKGDLWTIEWVVK